MRFRALLMLVLLASCSSGTQSSTSTVAPSLPFTFSPAASADAIPDSEATTKPELVSAGKRRYPSGYEYGQKDGTAVFRFVIMPSGKVDPSTIEVLEATAPDFAAAGVRTVAESRFSPGKLDGKPVRVRVTQRVSWRASADADCQWTGGTSLLPPKCIKPPRPAGS